MTIQRIMTLIICVLMAALIIWSVYRFVRGMTGRKASGSDSEKPKKGEGSEDCSKEDGKEDDKAGKSN